MLRTVLLALSILLGVSVATTALVTDSVAQSEKKKPKQGLSPKVAKPMKAAQEAGFEFAVTEFKAGGSGMKVRRLSTRKDEEMTAEGLRKALEGLKDGS